MAKNRDFRVIKLAQKLCTDIVEMQGKADKSYRFTICQDIRKKSEDVIHMVRKANGQPAGCEKRIEMQEQADDFLEDIKDLLPVVGKLLNIGINREAQIELSIESLQQPLHNWMERDEKTALSMCEKRLNAQAWKLYQAKKTYELVNDYYKSVKTEKIAIALEQSKSRYRIEHDGYRALVHEYDRLMKRLLSIQEKFHKDDSVLGEVLKEIGQKTGKAVPVLNGKSPVPDAVVAEKKKVQKEVKRKVAESDKEFFSQAMISYLCGTTKQ